MFAGRYLSPKANASSATLFSKDNENDSQIVDVDGLPPSAAQILKVHS